MKQAKIFIRKEELMELLKTYFTDEVEACPLNAEAFCNLLLEKYKIEDSWKITYLDTPSSKGISTN